jgi:DNA repair exonuclease SbcCD nuclease subunit
VTVGKKGRSFVVNGHPRPPVRLLHTSDLHLGLTYGFGGGPEQGEVPFAALAALVAAAATHDATAVLIAGDLFDHNRVSDAVVARAATLLAAMPCPVVVLPGNHDPYTSDSVYARAADRLPQRVHVLRAAGGELVCLPGGGLQVWGQAHTSYDDFHPFGVPPRWADAGGGRSWRVAVAHGHVVTTACDRRFSYRIAPEDLARLGADYVALGHWDTPTRVDGGGPPAWYAGSPCRTGHAALVTFDGAGVSVRQVPLGRPRPHAPGRKTAR